MESADMKTRPYGTWPSPITPDSIDAETIRLASVSLDAGRLGWLEGRPGEGGRNVLVRADETGRTADVTRADDVAVTTEGVSATAGRRDTVRLIALFCILSWRVFWLTMLNRVEPNLEPALVLSELETSILDRLIPNPAHDPPAARTLSLYLTKIARLGGYLARAKDPPPGNIVMWRGLSRLNDITLGATLQADVVGN